MRFTKGTPWQIAATRAVLSASLVGGLGFLAVWTQTSDPRTLVAAGLTPALTVLVTRLGVEGTVDSKAK